MERQDRRGGRADRQDRRTASDCDTDTTERQEREIFKLLFSVPFWRFFGGPEEFQQLHEKYEISSFAVWKKSSNSGEFVSRSSRSQKWNWEQRNLLVSDRGAALLLLLLLLGFLMCFNHRSPVACAVYHTPSPPSPSLLNCFLLSLAGSRSDPCLSVVAVHRGTFRWAINRFAWHHGAAVATCCCLALSLCIHHHVHVLAILLAVQFVSSTILSLAISFDLAAIGINCFLCHLISFQATFA